MPRTLHSLHRKPLHSVGVTVSVTEKSLEATTPTGTGPAFPDERQSAKRSSAKRRSARKQSPSTPEKREAAQQRATAGSPQPSLSPARCSPGKKSPAKRIVAGIATKSPTKRSSRSSLSPAKRSSRSSLSPAKRSPGKGSSRKATGAEKQPKRSSAKRLPRLSPAKGPSEAIPRIESPLGEKGTEPLRAEEDTEPPHAEEDTEPLHAEDTKPPRVEEDTEPPHAEEDTEPPHAEEDTEPPRAEEDTKPPRAEEDTEPPHAEEDTEPPHAEEDTEPPHAEEDTEPPHAEEDTEPPHAEEDTEPLRSEREKEPVEELLGGDDVVRVGGSGAPELRAAEGTLKEEDAVEMTEGTQVMTEGTQGESSTIPHIAASPSPSKPTEKKKARSQQKRDREKKKKEPKEPKEKKAKAPKEQVPKKRKAKVPKEGERNAVKVESARSEEADLPRASPAVNPSQSVAPSGISQGLPEMVSQGLPEMVSQGLPEMMSQGLPAKPRPDKATTSAGQGAEVVREQVVIKDLDTVCHSARETKMKTDVRDLLYNRLVPWAAARIMHLVKSKEATAISFRCPDRVLLALAVHRLHTDWLELVLVLTTSKRTSAVRGLAEREWRESLERFLVAHACKACKDALGVVRVAAVAPTPWPKITPRWLDPMKRLDDAAVPRDLVSFVNPSKLVFTGPASVAVAWSPLLSAAMDIVSGFRGTIEVVRQDDSGMPVVQSLLAAAHSDPTLTTDVLAVAAAPATWVVARGEEGEVLGGASLHRFASHVEVVFLYVTEAARRRGAASQLLCMAKVLACSWRTPLLAITARGEAMEALVSKLGWTQDTAEKVVQAYKFGTKVFTTCADEAAMPQHPPLLRVTRKVAQRPSIQQLRAENERLRKHIREVEQKYREAVKREREATLVPRKVKKEPQADGEKKTAKGTKRPLPTDPVHDRPHPLAAMARASMAAQVNELAATAEGGEAEAHSPAEKEEEPTCNVMSMKPELLEIKEEPCDADVKVETVEGGRLGEPEVACVRRVLGVQCGEGLSPDDAVKLVGAVVCLRSPAAKRSFPRGTLSSLLDLATAKAKEIAEHCAELTTIPSGTSNHDDWLALVDAMCIASSSQEDSGESLIALASAVDRALPTSSPLRDWLWRQVCFESQ